jgi:2-oxo-4-hydroxy-4-carboxy-5-ureidoimidazoline decarboxylase
VSPATALDRFNALPDDEARLVLLACCTSPRWVELLVRGRPYPGTDELYRAADRASAELTEAELGDALAGHPRIGERRDGDAASAREQAGVGRADAATREAIAAANWRYEQRFGHVYLVAASGRSAEDLLADLRRRLGNDQQTEQSVLRRELAKINRNRLARLVEERGS